MKRTLLTLALVMLTLPAFGQKWDSILASNASCVYGACVFVDLDQKDNFAVVQVSGTFTATLQFEASADKTNYVSIAGTPSAGGSAVTSATAAGAWQFNVSGYKVLRVRASAYTTGTATAKITLSQSALSNVNYPGVTSSGTNGLAVAGNLEVGTTVLPLPVEKGFGSGSFVPSANNPISGSGVFAQSVMVNSDGSCDAWYQGSGGRTKYLHATDALCEQWSSPVDVQGSLSGSWYPYVFKVGSTYYLLEVDKETGPNQKLYLFSSTDKLNFTAQNGGNPVLTASSTSTDWYYQFYNPAVWVNGSTWYLFLEANGASSIGASSATGCPTTCSFQTNVTSSTILKVSNPQIIAVPDRSAVVMVATEGFDTVGGIVAFYADSSSDPTLNASWTLAQGMRLWNPSRIGIGAGPSDPTIAFTPRTGLKPWNGIMLYSYKQNVGHQAYTSMTLNQWYDAITDPIGQPAYTPPYPPFGVMDGDTTPDLYGGIKTNLQIQFHSPTTITNFLHGATGQTLQINCDSSGYGTVQANAKILLVNGESFVCTSDREYLTLTWDGAYWREVNRSVRTHQALNGYQLLGAATHGAWSWNTTASQAITLSTTGTTTDSGNNLLVANSIIKSVSCRVTTAIQGATNWSIGDSTTPARFCAASTNLAATTTQVCGDHWATGKQWQAANAKLRITTTGTPSAGVVYCAVVYENFKGPDY